MTMGNFWSRVWQAVQHNKGTKLASLLLALICWYAIQAAISFEAVVTDVPLTVKVNEGWAVLDRSDKTVDVLFADPARISGT